jgi:hypothetical protein
MYTYWKIVRNEKEEEGWSAIDEDLTGFYDPLISIGSGAQKDTFAFKLLDFNDAYENYFQPTDKITISRVINSTTVSTSDIKIVGCIKDIPETETGTANSLTIEGYNFSEAILGAIVFVDGNNDYVPIVIQRALDFASENHDFKVTWDPSNDTFIAGITFSQITERFFNKPIKDILEKYSSNKYNTSGYNFYWYVTNNNTLIWRPMLDVNVSTFVENTDEHTSIKISKDIKGVRNFFVLKGGYDPAGKQIQTKYIDYESYATHGPKYLFVISENNAAKNLIALDILQSYGNSPQDVNYPNLTANFTTAWKAQFTYTTKAYSISVTAGSPVTITGGSELERKKAYVEVIRTEVTKRLQAEGKEYADYYKFGKLKVDLEFVPGVKNWVIGDVIQCTIPKLSSAPKNLRVTEIQYAEDADTYSLEEDIGTI